MATSATLIGLGVPGAQAGVLGAVEATAQTASATTKATASTLGGTVVAFSTVASSGAVLLPPAQSVNGPVAIYNGGANSLSVFTTGTAETINALSAAQAFSVTNAKAAIFMPGNLKWVAVLSA
jgi:hypothetical protein